MPQKPYPKIEEDILEFWDKDKTFEKSLRKESPQGDYVFYDGPPFATGLPHYGHILGSTVKDVVGRYWTMKGYHVARRWGWDCHGLPIENIVEQKLGINTKKEIHAMGVERFNNECRSQVLTYVKEWGKTVRRVGRWVDFENSYKTMDHSYIESVWWAFKEIWKKGLIYEGKKVLLNCPRCETPIAKAEVAMDNSYKDITEESVYVKFQMKGEENISFLAWTTTPWTLPGNVALTVGADIEYVKVKQRDEFYIIAKDRLGVLEGEYGVVETMKGKKLIGLGYEPLYSIPEILKAGGPLYRVTDADFVSTQEGTGIVHSAVAYGEDDYKLGLKVGLPVVPLLNDKAIFEDKAPEFLRGVYFKDADKRIVEDLQKRGLVYKTESFTHSYPHCHRCETPLFYNAINAWFLDIQKIKPRLLELNEKIHWFPEHFKRGRFQKSVEEAPDWNLSRNRFWASALPIWRCEKKSCKAIEVIGSVKELREKALDVPSGEIDLHKHELDGIYLSCQRCGTKMRRIPEVIDCWFESASMPFAAVHYPFENRGWFEENFPAQFIAEYTGQIRTWFYYMLVLSACLFDKIPFENVVVTGVVLAEDGSKMSKRLRNYPDPAKIFDTYGVDSLRYYLLSSAVMKAEDLWFSEKGVMEVYRNLVILLFNVVSFYSQYKTQAQIIQLSTSPVSVKHILDQWILARLYELISEASASLDAYDISHAVRPIEEFINDLSTWYLRRSRERFKGGDAEGIKVFGYVLFELSKVMAPCMPFLAEWVYGEIMKPESHEVRKSVHLESWPRKNQESRITNQELEVLQNMKQARKIVEMALAKRAEAGIKVRQPLQKLTIMSVHLSVEYKRLVQEELNVKEVVFQEGDTLSVELDTSITPELGLEGQARQFIRQINNLRKQKGLTTHDRIKIYYEGEIKELIETFGKEIIKATLADGLEAGKGEDPIKIGDKVIKVSLIEKTMNQEL